MPAGSGAATSSAASARRSSRCRPRSICCVRCRNRPTTPEVVLLAATDPANPYGTMLGWPATPRRTRGRCRPRPDANGRRARRARQRRACARTSAAAARQLAGRSCPRTNRRARRRPCARRRLARARAPARRRPADRRNQRRARVGAPARAVSRSTAGFSASAMGFQVRRPSSPLTTPRTPDRTSPVAPADMPEGDTIFRAARTLHRALAGKPVVRFESMFPALTRIHDDTPITGRTIERVRVVGQAPADALLRRAGAAHAHAHERQLAHLSAGRAMAAARGATCASSSRPATSKRSGSTSRSPSSSGAQSARHDDLRRLGPDLLVRGLRRSGGARAACARGRDIEIAEVLLNAARHGRHGQRLQVGGAVRLWRQSVRPHRNRQRRCGAASRRNGAKFLRMNVSGKLAAMTTYTGVRRTTKRADPRGRLWVYGRARLPCRRCGTAIRVRAKGRKCAPHLLVSEVPALGPWGRSAASAFRWHRSVASAFRRKIRLRGRFGRGFRLQAEDSLAWKIRVVASAFRRKIRLRGKFGSWLPPSGGRFACVED